MAFTTFYQLYKTSGSPSYIDRGINSFEVTAPDFGKLELGRGMIVFSKKRFNDNEIKMNDIISLKWNFVKESTITYSTIKGLIEGDIVTFSATGNLNMSVCGKITNISSTYIKNIIMKNNIRAKEMIITLCVISATVS